RGAVCGPRDPRAPRAAVALPEADAPHAGVGGSTTDARSGHSPAARLPHRRHAPGAHALRGHRFLRTHGADAVASESISGVSAGARPPRPLGPPGPRRPPLGAPARPGPAPRGPRRP